MDVGTPTRRRSLWWGRLALLGILAVAIPRAVSVSTSHLLKAAGRLDETREEAYARRFGAEYRTRIAEIRRTIPEDALYFLVDAGNPDDSWALWVRYDLAPRRAIALGKLSKVRPGDIRRRARQSVAWAVVAQPGGQPPELFDRQAFERGLVESRERKRAARHVGS